MVEAPVEEYFKEHNLPYDVEELPWAKTKDKRLKIYVASIYDINFDDIGKFDVIWDRGSQTAIETSDRDRYAKVIKRLCKENFLYLMSTMQYDLEDDETEQRERPNALAKQTRNGWKQRVW
ncbi:Thiopurine S-methyltransferase [Armadillidium vulgare]|nr:Thiopurine S-methyltransferase [Armadillidium vulgare]